MLLKKEIVTVLFYDSNAAMDVPYDPKLNNCWECMNTANYFTQEQIIHVYIQGIYTLFTENLVNICTNILTSYVNDYLYSKLFISKWKGVLEEQNQLHYS